MRYSLLGKSRRRWLVVEIEGGYPGESGAEEDGAEPVVEETAVEGK
jgi:hypothetical protein